MARFFSAVLVILGAGPSLYGADPATSEFFEARVRPLLVEHCHACHSAKAGKAKGGLMLDNRAAILKGGDNGLAVVAGDPGKSRLIEAVGYGNVDLQMPPKGKLADRAIQDLTAWIRAGAVWPDSASTAKTATAEFDLGARRANHWCWQQVKRAEPPPGPGDPVDRFIRAKLAEHKLAPSPAADSHTLIRRLSFDLTGLPPTPDEVESFVQSAQRDPQAAIQQAADRMLASPRFGERWARHWLDLMRYSETRGHEFDHPNPQAWQYRDYVIRALNADVPYDQFVREHIAGDLIPRPRLHPSHGWNESVLGTGWWWFGEQVHSPVDLKQDEADRFDNAIDVFGKTFLGLTVACARCHDHKFDAISTRDYYALFNVIASSGYRQVRFETELQEREIARKLAAVRDREQMRLRTAVADVLRGTTEASPAKAGKIAAPTPEPTLVFDFGQATPDEWRPDGVGFGFRPTRVGELRLGMVAGRPPMSVVSEPAAEVDPAWENLVSAGGTTTDPGDLGKSPRSGRTIRTPPFTLDGRKLYYRVRGQGLVYAAVHHHHTMEGPLHRKLVQSLDAGDGYRWIEHDLTRYAGHRLHIEFTATSPVFAVSRVVMAVGKPLDESGGRESKDLSSILDRWAAGGDITAAEAATLHAMVQSPDETLRNRLGAAVRPVIEELRRIRGPSKRESHLAGAMFEGGGVDGRVYIRGNPKAHGETVPRRFLEALAGPNPLPGMGSGRLDLARQVTDPALNPLFARVIVNRVWHHLLGRGLVASVDNFGVMGDAPTHPELLDFLADRFVREGWSLKKLIRHLVLTQTYQQASTLRPDAADADPNNLLLHRAHLKRLDGESIRDALLQLSGRLDPTMFGPSIPTHLTAFHDGRGKPAKSGPADGAGRRSIYLEVRRNFLNPFLIAFDTPSPFSTVGRRPVSNVPAQALILLNDPFVAAQAKQWVERIRNETDVALVDRLYREAIVRPPTADERNACVEFVAKHGRPALGHALVNVKEFIYLH